MTRPDAQPTNPILRLAGELFAERRRGAGPHGALRFDLRRSRQLARDPLSVLMPLYKEYGPVFSIRVLHAIEIFMIGPAANHLITVSRRDNFLWREGSMGELIPLLGDGLLTTDGEYHDRAREILMPAFHGERISAALGAIEAETARAISGWRDGEVIDIYEWSRATSIRIAMRALIGLDPDDRGAGAKAARHFERALRYYGTDFHVRLLRGPGTPWSRTQSSRRALEEIIRWKIAERRAGEQVALDEQPGDVLSLLTAAESPSGTRLSEQEVSDQAITLLFASHDTMTSALSMMFYELARNPGELDAVNEEIAAADSEPTRRPAEPLPRLLRCLDETLRLYPPAWVGPRRSIHAFEFEGVTVPAHSSVNYSSLLTQRLPEVFPDPARFDSDRFLPEARAALPPGAYVPFGAGPRICLGKRFALAEAQAVVATVLRRFRPQLIDGRPLSLHPMPTLGPEGGLKLRVNAR